MAWFLGAAVWVVTIAIVGVLAARIWWFPPPISELAVRFDDHFALTLVLCGFFFVLAQGTLGYAVIRYREVGQRRAGCWQGSSKWVWAIAAVMVLLDVSLSRGSGRIWTEQQITPPVDVLRIEVTGQQFAWNVRYPGSDGRFGRTDPKLMDDVSNPRGLDPKDPRGRDDIVIPTILVPLRRPVVLLLRSKDVIHSLFIRELRIKQDAVPGMEIA